MYLSPGNLGEVSDMLGRFSAADAGQSGLADGSDARSAALRLMSNALAQLDSDASIPAVIGAHLQSAIDLLWASASGSHGSTQLH